MVNHVADHSSDKKSSIFRSVMASYEHFIPIDSHHFATFQIDIDELGDE